MKLSWIVVIAAMMSLTLNAASPAGTWKGSMDTQMGKVEMTITFQAGTALAGTVKSDQFDAPVEKAKLDSDRISFEIHIEYGKVAFEGTVADSEMKLTVTGTTGNKYPLNCTRQK
jgi:hypothetical protein